MSGRIQRFAMSSVTVSVLALGACAGGAGNGGSATPAQGSVVDLANPGPSVETVNGEAVPEKLLKALAQKNNLDLSRPEARERAMHELTNFVLVAQAARDRHYADDPDFAAMVEVNRLQGIAQAALVEFRKRGKVDEATLRADYDKQNARVGNAEYDFSHIVFANEAEAVAATREIAKGKKFDAVLDEHKKDARQARSFSHIRSGQLPKPLADALAAMKPGDTTKSPIQTRFGWHVVHLTAMTPYTPPPFEQVKDNLERIALKRAAEDEVNKLRAQAKIVVTASTETPAPAPGTPAKPAAPAAKPKG